MRAPERGMRDPERGMRVCTGGAYGWRLRRAICRWGSGVRSSAASPRRLHHGRRRQVSRPRLCRPRLCRPRLCRPRVPTVAADRQAADATRAPTRPGLAGYHGMTRRPGSNAQPGPRQCTGQAAVGATCGEPQVRVRTAIMRPWSRAAQQWPGGARKAREGARCPLALSSGHETEEGSTHGARSGRSRVGRCVRYDSVRSCGGVPGGSVTVWGVYVYIE